MKINIDYLARVEGEGSVKLEIKDGKLKDLKLNIWEPPRFFEGFLCGRRFDEVPDRGKNLWHMPCFSHVDFNKGFRESIRYNTVRGNCSSSKYHDTEPACLQPSHTSFYACDA